MNQSPPLDSDKQGKSLWNTDYEKILKEWKARSFVSMWLQLKSGYYYVRINDWLTYPVIALSSVGSATLFASNSNTARLVIAMFSIITVIITGLLIELCPGQKAEQHMSTMRRYTTLIRNIDYCLALPPHMRPEPITFIDKTNIEMDNISEYENIIPKFIIAKFERRFGNLDKLLYGDEIVDLLAEDIKQTRIATKLLLRNESRNTTSTEMNYRQSIEIASTPTCDDTNMNKVKKF
jgi:hypothetical protein